MAAPGTLAHFFEGLVVAVVYTTGMQSSNLSAAHDSVPARQCLTDSAALMLSLGNV